jgi:DNA-directed RNA polymerase specialized sigma24 family protein
MVVRQDVLGKLLRKSQTVLGGHSRLFIKRHLEDLSEEEVAEAIGMKRGTASGYLSRSPHRLYGQQARFTVFL